MSLKKLFDKNKQTTIVSKFLKDSSPGQLGDGIESQGHLSESIKKRDTFLPNVDYSNPSNFVKFGSAEEYYRRAYDFLSGYYPYDGSAFEKTKFYNDLNPLEKYIFLENYPRSTGFITIGDTYGPVTSKTNGYYSSSAEYIETYGGPHKDTVYNVGTNRTSNLNFGGPSGSTVEFFFKKNTGIPAGGIQSRNQVIFDLWNGVVSSSAEYGRMTFEIMSGSTPGQGEDRFLVTMLSGTTGFFTQSVPTLGGLSFNSGSWHNYSFSFNTSKTNPTIDFYVDGSLHEGEITSSTLPTSGHQAGEIKLVTGSLTSNIGGLRTAPFGAADSSDPSRLGWAKLSGSIDEFRFWKSNRNAQEIGRHWFSHVDGGADKYNANVDLGVYYKFNEGIVGADSVDRIVLDYSGRLSNGAFINYDSSSSRSTLSAMSAMSQSGRPEKPDIIVRPANPRVSTNRAGLILSGSSYDATNNGSLKNQIPSWIIEEEESGNNELRSLLQIMASYFDTLHLQISALNKIKDRSYEQTSTTGSMFQFPYTDRLIEEFGIEAPEIFENIGAMGQFLERDEQISFQKTLIHTKNSIYKNIYNNLPYILKSKGTEKSIRNLIRCFGIGEEIMTVGVYPNEADYTLSSSYREGPSTKKYIDFTGFRNSESPYSTIYQYAPSSSYTSSYSILSGSEELNEYAFTLQGEFLFPDKSQMNTLRSTPPPILTSSLFGFHTPPDEGDNATSTNLNWPVAAGDYGWQIYAVKAEASPAKNNVQTGFQQDAYFVIKNRAGEEVLKTDVFRNVYDNQKWNVAVSLRPDQYPFATTVDGTNTGAGSGWILEFYGVNYEAGLKQNSFSISSSLNYPSGSLHLTSSKRIYAGAHRTNFNGQVDTLSDIKASSIRYWNDYLSPTVIDLHAKDVDSFGRLHPERNAYTFQKPASAGPINRSYIPAIQTLALNWDFQNISSSNIDGQFRVTDVSSGSVGLDYLSTYQGRALSNANLRKHPGRADFFAASEPAAFKEYVYTSKLRPPEESLSDEMIKILSHDDEAFGTDVRPSSIFFAVEKSMNRSISDRILNFFASIDDFHNLIGEPVNKYRDNYKQMEKLREIFFRRVEGVPDFEKYLDFYKWVDTSMGEIIQQLFPASAKHAEDVRTMIESHVLERHKMRYGYPGAVVGNYPIIEGRIGR